MRIRTAYASSLLVVCAGAGSLLVVHGRSAAGPKAAKPPTGFTLKKVIALGEPAPGGGNFVAASDFELGELNAKGQISFVTEVPEGEGLFFYSGGTLEKLMRPGDPSPAGGTFGPIAGFHPTTNAKGEVAFWWYGADYGTPAGTNAVVYRWSKGRLSAVYTIGDAAPGGGTFQGALMHADINARGDIVFAALVSGADVDPSTPPGDSGLGAGIFLADRAGHIRAVARPGDAATDGKTFDFAQNPSVNDLGDVAFGAHVAGDECIAPGNDQHLNIFCFESVYVRRADGRIESIAHQGDPASGGAFRLAFGPVVNNAGDVCFAGDLTPAPDSGKALGIFLNHDGYNGAVVRPGDLMPGGGHVTSTSFQISNYDVNGRGDVCFSAALDIDDDHDGRADTGVFMRPAGSLAPVLVARTGTVVADVGTIAHIQNAPSVGQPLPLGGAVMNDKGQVAFQAVLADGRVVLFVGTPHK